MLDRKTGEKVHFLFAVRAGRISKTYINDTIIPALCRKAGIPAADVRGPITSHRARSTIATQLYNAKEPMTLFELQAWLGQRSPESTQHYAKITPNTLTKACSDAGYFARNIRTIEVLVDRDAVTGGAAATGEPWQHYDLGHGFCSYTFFEQCPHRMACARCDFYVPKQSSKSELLQAKTNLQRMLVDIPLTDDEQAAVEDGQAALDQLLQRLADVPTPTGTTPREQDAPPTAIQLRIITVNHGRSARSGQFRFHRTTEQAALKCLYLVTRSLDPTGAGRARWTMRWLSRPGARRRHCCRSVSPDRSPKPACASRRTGLSTIGCRQAVVRRRNGLGILLPRWRYRRTVTDAGLNTATPPAAIGSHRPVGVVNFRRNTFQRQRCRFRNQRISRQFTKCRSRSSV